MIQLRGRGTCPAQQKRPPPQDGPPATPLGLTEAISARGLLFAASLAVRASTDRRKSGNRASVATGKPTVMLPVLIFVAARWGNFPSCPTIATAGNCRECKNQMQVCSHFALTLNVGVSKNQFAVKVIMVCEARGQKLHNPLVAVTYVFPEWVTSAVCWLFKSNSN